MAVDLNRARCSAILYLECGSRDEGLTFIYLTTIVRSPDAESEQKSDQTLANSPSARKRARQAVKHRQHNVSQRTKLRTRIKAVVKSIHAGDKAAAEDAFKLAQPSIDSAVGKKLIHANKAARHKSRLNARIKAM